MKVAAIQRTSFVDYPGRIAAVVFTPGCNLDCFYCHNRMLLGCDANDPGTTPPSHVLEYLRRHQGLLDAVVISGGEPILQPGLAEFIAEIRALGYLAKLDTNGTQPTVLASLIDAGLLDYVAMDIKAPPEKYDSICGVHVDHESINASIDRLLYDRIGYEFRTTVIPQLTKADILTIGRRIRGARLYVLQRYRRPESIAPLPDPRLDETPRPASWMLEVVEKLKDTVRHCGVRGFDYSHSDKTETRTPILPQ